MDLDGVFDDDDGTAEVLNDLKNSTTEDVLSCASVYSKTKYESCETKATDYNWTSAANENE